MGQLRLLSLSIAILSIINQEFIIIPLDIKLEGMRSKLLDGEFKME
jgi:hypothetical protein